MLEHIIRTLPAEPLALIMRERSVLSKCIQVSRGMNEAIEKREDVGWVLMRNCGRSVGIAVVITTMANMWQAEIVRAAETILFRAMDEARLLSSRKRRELEDIVSYGGLGVMADMLENEMMTWEEDYGASNTFDRLYKLVLLCDNIGTNVSKPQAMHAIQILIKYLLKEENEFNNGNRRQIIKCAVHLARKADIAYSVWMPAAFGAVYKRIHTEVQIRNYVEADTLFHIANEMYRETHYVLPWDELQRFSELAVTIVKEDALYSGVASSFGGLAAVFLREQFSVDHLYAKLVMRDNPVNSGKRSFFFGRTHYGVDPDLMLTSLYAVEKACDRDETAVSEIIESVPVDYGHLQRTLIYLECAAIAQTLDPTEQRRLMEAAGAFARTSAYDTFDEIMKYAERSDTLFVAMMSEIHDFVVLARETDVFGQYMESVVRVFGALARALGAHCRREADDWDKLTVTVIESLLFTTRFIVPLELRNVLSIDECAYDRCYSDVIGFPTKMRMVCGLTRDCGVTMA